MEVYTCCGRLLRVFMIPAKYKYDHSCNYTCIYMATGWAVNLVAHGMCKQTPLHLAAKRGREGRETMDVLWAYKADPDMTDEEGRRARELFEEAIRSSPSSPSSKASMSPASHQDL